MNTFSSKIILTLTCFLGSLLFSSPLSAAVYSGKDVVIALKPGETREITIETLGAKTAKRVWVTGRRGIVASKLRKQSANPNQLKIRLVANSNATTGPSQLNLDLLAGVHTRTIWVHALPVTDVNIPNSTLVGNKARVTLNGMRKKYTSVSQGNRGLEIKGRYPRYYVEVTANRSQNRRQVVSLNIIENTMPGRTGSRYNHLIRKSKSVVFQHNPQLTNNQPASTPPPANNSNGRNANRNNSSQRNSNQQNRNRRNRNNNQAVPQQLADLVPVRLIDHWRLGQAVSMPQGSQTYNYYSVNRDFCRSGLNATNGSKSYGVGGAGGTVYRKSFTLPNTIGIEIKNNGRATASNFVVQLLKNNQVLRSENVSSLRAGQSQTIRVSRPKQYNRRKSVLKGGGLSTAGCFAGYGTSTTAVDDVYTVRVDANNTVNEASESNNSAIFDFR